MTVAVGGGGGGGGGGGDPVGGTTLVPPDIAGSALPPLPEHAASAIALTQVRIARLACGDILVVSQVLLNWTWT